MRSSWIMHQCSSPGIGHNGSILAGAVLISCFPTSTLRSQTKWYRGHDNKQERDSRVPGERPPRRGGDNSGRLLQTRRLGQNNRAHPRASNGSIHAMRVAGGYTWRGCS